MASSNAATPDLTAYLRDLSNTVTTLSNNVTTLSNIVTTLQAQVAMAEAEVASLRDDAGLLRMPTDQVKTLKRESIRLEERLKKAETGLFKLIEKDLYERTCKEMRGYLQYQLSTLLGKWLAVLGEENSSITPENIRRRTSARAPWKNTM